MLPQREYFLHIHPHWTFYLLAGAACAVFLWGVRQRVRTWLANREPRSPAAPLSAGRVVGHILRDGLLGRRLLRADPRAWLAHLLIQWGFIGLFLGTATISVDHYLVGFLTGRIYLVFSLILEILGLALVAGTVWVLVRRFLLKPTRLERRAEDLTLPLFLLAVVLTGFVIESARLGADTPAWAAWSAVGAALARLWPSPEAARAAQPVLWWVHTLLSLGLIAWLPYSKLFHSLAAPVSLALQDRPLEPVFSDDEDEERPLQDGEPETLPVLGLREAIHLDACTRCGLCLEVCPAYGAGEPMGPRDLVQELKGDREANPGQAWYCTTCRACFEICPVAVAPLAIIRKVRSRIVEEGVGVPPMLGEGLERLYKYANPWMAKKGRKADWLDSPEPTGLEDPARKEPGGELLYFVGCTTSLETRAQGLARSLAAILHHVGVDFRTLGKKEPCCGDIARQLGELGLFADQRDKTLRALTKKGLGRVVTSSPHCYDAFAKTYPPALTSDPKPVPFRPQHYSQVLAKLVEEGRLKFKDGPKLRATFHDPCYLARHNGIVEPPRRVIEAIPGVELVEMADHGLKSLCCGGGGGRMWQELEGQPAQGSMAHRRLAQARDVGAEVVVTACPLCLIMLEDGRKTGGFEDSLKITDLAELTAWALGLNAGEEQEGEEEL